MTLYEFKLLDKEQQYDVTFNQGAFIEYQLELNRRFALYAVDKFFVEIEYDAEENKILKLLSFIQGPLLDRYIK